MCAYRNVTLHSISRFNIGLSGLHCRLNLLSQAQQICMTFLFQLVSIAKVSSPRRYWYRDIWYRDISWYRQYRPTLVQGTNVPGNEWSRERKFHHGNECSRERIVLGTNIPAFVISLQSVLAPYNNSRLAYAGREKILAATFNYIRRSLLRASTVIFPVPGLSNDNLLCHQ